MYAYQKTQRFSKFTHFPILQFKYDEYIRKDTDLTEVEWFQSCYGLGKWWIIGFFY